MDNCAPFQEFATSAQQRGCREFILDFSSCVGVDSTFLGVLLGISLSRESESCHVAAINVPMVVARVLREVGIDRVLDVVDGQVELPDIEMHRLEPLVGDLNRLERILKAHENLCRVNSTNREAFGSFVSLLREELGRGTPSEPSKQIRSPDSATPLIPVELMPIPIRRVWGGTRILDELHPGLEATPPIGESWEVSDVGDEPHLHSVIASGPFAGSTLRQWIAKDPSGVLGSALLNENSDLRLPLLFKFIDARENLSVQLHPSKEVLSASSCSGDPKSEAWVILDAEVDASIVYGFEDGWNLKKAIEEEEAGRSGTGFRRVPVKRGDVINLPAGTVHAIGAGILLAEIQQSSDTTWRIHDWGRLGLDGKPRKLHLQEAAQVTTAKPEPQCPLPQPASWDSWVRRIDDGPFTLDELRANAPEVQVPTSPNRFSILALLEGEGDLCFEGGSLSLSAGSVSFIPAGCLTAVLRSKGDTWALSMAPAFSYSH